MATWRMERFARSISMISAIISSSPDRRSRHRKASSQHFFLRKCFGRIECLLNRRDHGLQIGGARGFGAEFEIAAEGGQSGEAERCRRALDRMGFPPYPPPT